jgi:hypothetical protein
LVKALPIVAGLLTAACSLGLATLCESAEEDNAASQLQACASIRGDIDRLACYDKAFGGQLVATPATSQPQTPAPQPPSVAAKKPTNDGLMVSEDQVGWSNKETTSGLDNSQTETAILPAATAKISRFASGGLAQHAALIIRCREGKTDLFVAYTDIVDGMEPTNSTSAAMQDRWGLLKRCSNWQASRGQSHRSGPPAIGDAASRASLAARVNSPIGAVLLPTWSILRDSTCSRSTLTDHHLWEGLLGW